MSAIASYQNCSTQSMFRHCKTTARVIRNAKEVALVTHPPTAALSAASASVRTAVTMSNDVVDPHQLDAIFQKKRSLRYKIRKELKNMGPIQRSQEAQEGNTQMKKKLFVPRVEDRNSNMRMLKISSVKDLVASSMNILEPSLLDSDGNQREDVMQASEPVDLFILPGLAFDKSGRRLGRSGGYYDVFLKKYQKLAQERKWKPPLCVALSYSLQVVEEESIPVTPHDVPVDALVSPRGFIPISPVAIERCD